MEVPQEMEVPQACCREFLHYTHSHNEEVFAPYRKMWSMSSQHTRNWFSQKACWGGTKIVLQSERATCNMCTCAAAVEMLSEGDCTQAALQGQLILLRSCCMMLKGRKDGCMMLKGRRMVI